MVITTAKAAAGKSVVILNDIDSSGHYLAHNVPSENAGAFPHRHARCVYHASMVFLILLLFLGVQFAHAQTPAPVALANVQRLKCAFTVKALGTWDKEMVPTSEITSSKLSMVFDAIDTQDGTANVIEVNAPDAGAPHITVRLLAN